VNWNKYAANPVLSEGGYGSFSEYGVGTPSVVKVGSTYHMAYLAFDGYNVSSVGYATSSDGIQWTEAPGNPYLSRRPGEVFDSVDVAHPSLFWDPNESEIKAYYRGSNETTWAIASATVAAAPEPSATLLRVCALLIVAVLAVARGRPGTRASP